MIDAGLLPVDRPSPADLLEDRFRAILQRQMQDVPMLNPALSVEAVGLRPWSDHWLGILVTPWFMNLVLLPRVLAKWQPIGERETRHYVFPAGVFEFIGARDVVLGDYQACSLFSPMFDFANQQGARDTAMAALDALFDVANRDDTSVRRGASLDPAAAPSTATAGRVLSKREFLFATPPRSDRGP
jgi:[NiFe] hydrogenase assembly HybE family chaperone